MNERPLRYLKPKENREAIDKQVGELLRYFSPMRHEFSDGHIMTVLAFALGTIALASQPHDTVEEIAAANKAIDGIADEVSEAIKAMFLIKVGEDTDARVVDGTDTKH
jgi:hypothetical protein